MASASAHAGEPDTGQAEAEYQQWVDRYAPAAMTRRVAEGGVTQLKLVIVTVQGEQKQDADEGRRLFGGGISTYVTELSSDGHVSWRSHSDFGSKGSSGGPPIPEADLTRLDQLLANPPDDGSRLPPAGRRVLVQAVVGDRTIRRVYDTADAPEDVREVLRLSRSGIGAWVPRFEPQDEIEAERSGHGGLLSLSPDGQQILFACGHSPLQFWEPTTHELLAEVRGLNGSEIAFSPDGTQAVMIEWGECAVVDTETWKKTRVLAEPSIERRRHGLSAPQFTADGRHLLLRTTEPSLRVFDARTWERVDRLPHIPDDAVAYAAASRSRLAVVQSREELYLWDADQHRVVRRLEESGYASDELRHAAFSPDESLVAVAIRKKGGTEREHNIRIWKTENGELLHKLRPFEQAICENVEGMIWSPDGEYVMAANVAHSFFTSRGISLWSVRTGRHRGEFTGPSTNVNGIALLPDGKRLLAGCTDGRIRFWDFAGAMKQIREFEGSLTALEASRR